MSNVGKTTILINFLKLINKKILIIDFDINKPNIHSFLGLKKYSKIINNIIKNKKENDLINYLNNKKDNYDEFCKFIYKNFLIKINNNKFLISGLDFISDFFNQIDLISLKKIFIQFLNQIKNKFNYILIDTGSDNKEINNIIFSLCDYNFIIIESNLIGINKFNNYLQNRNIENFNNSKYKIIINKKDKYCIDEKIINNIYENKIIGSISNKEIFSKLINKNYKLNIIDIFFEKKYKKEFLKIIEKIN